MDLSWADETDEWHEWRSHGLGGSDAPALMEVSPWTSVFELWADKCGLMPKFKGNEWTERGKRLEPIAREIYEKQAGAKFPEDRLIHPEFSFVRANFDGVNHDLKKVLEIKCPGPKDLQTAANGRVPRKYMPQIQWLLLVSGYSECDYVTFDGDADIYIKTVKAKPEYQEQLLEKAKWLWKYVEKFKGRGRG